MGELTHLDASGQARMVDVGDKPVTLDEQVVAGGRPDELIVLDRALDELAKYKGDRVKNFLRAVWKKEKLWTKFYLKLLLLFVKVVAACCKCATSMCS